MNSNRNLPVSYEAERSVLGTFLLYPHLFQVAVEEDLSTEDFYDNTNRIIYQRMYELHNENVITDITSLHTRLRNYNELDQIGGITYLHTLTEGVVSASNISHYISVIQKKSQQRKLILALDKALNASFDESEDLLALMSETEKAVLDVTRSQKTSDFQSSKMVVDDVLSQIQKIRDGGAPTGVRVGYTALDKVTHGFQRGDLIILAARPSMGKTAFALNMALKASKIDGQSIAVFSLEMPAEALMRRMLSSEGKIDSGKMRKGNLSNDEINQLYAAGSRLSNYKIYIDDSSSIKMTEIFSKCRKLKADDALDLVVIDYLQLIEGRGGKSENRQQEVSQISRELKALARELEVPVIALSQLSRSVETRQDKRPMLSDLRESGAIEQDADLVIFLYRDNYYKREEKDESEPDKTEINIAKHRNGLTTSIELAFDKKYSTFYNYGD